MSRFKRCQVHGCKGTVSKKDPKTLLTKVGKPEVGYEVEKITLKVCNQCYEHYESNKFGDEVGWAGVKANPFNSPISEFKSVKISNDRPY